MDSKQQTKHTPGPLAITRMGAQSERGNQYLIHPEGDDHPLHAIGIAYYVRALDVGKHDLLPAEANARLWAASPDLLAACVQMQPALIGYACWLRAEGNPIARDISALVDKLEAAIIKARGEASR